MSLPAPYGSHPWWLVAILATVVVLVAWAAGGQAFLERRYRDQFEPGSPSPD
jgi:hypothetical protein